MSTWLRTISLASLGWIALTCAAAAQGRADYQDMPLGDVWIATGKIAAYQRTSVDNTAAPESDVLAGDVWIAADDLVQTARIPNLHAQNSKSAVTGTINERPIGP